VASLWIWRKFDYKRGEKANQRLKDINNGVL